MGSIKDPKLEHEVPTIPLTGISLPGVEGNRIPMSTNSACKFSTNCILSVIGSQVSVNGLFDLNNDVFSIICS